MSSSRTKHEDINILDAPQADSIAGNVNGDVDIDTEFPNRPRNRGPSLPFKDLIIDIFDPVDKIRQRPHGPAAKSRSKASGNKRSPQEEMRLVIERFIAKWREETGNDLYPAFRLLVPDKDLERPMYGLKETFIAKLLVNAMGISKESHDAQLLINWKVPGKSAAARMAGDFAGRCFEMSAKRASISTFGTMTIDEVNDELDKLAAAKSAQEQQPIFTRLYGKMSAIELKWLIRMMLRQPLKFGASHETILRIFHPDAISLYNVTSSLRKVCWTLYDTSIRLDAADATVVPMQCYQPQLAQFQPQRAKNFAQIVANLQPTEEDPEFWIEEKLDGERVQLHMVTDMDLKGNRRFGFWSRKAKDYTPLYGQGLFTAGSLTQYLADAFDERVKSVILDGEMITWDPQEDAMVGFGTLKTAAKDQADNPKLNTGHRPLYRVFDILYLNGRSITNYTLRDRRKALEASIRIDKKTGVHGVYRRLEIHTYKSARSADEIEPVLRTVIAEASEGLVLKSPRSPYRLNERNDDWMKVKPEYMEESGEQFDCIVVGGYYGSGRRGGTLSSFLCGLFTNRDSSGSGTQQPGSRWSQSQFPQAQIQASKNPQFTLSFFKVGGGFKAEDYARIRHHTDGKWNVWDPEKPPRDWIELGGWPQQFERPDMWIKPEDSVVVQVKAASIRGSSQFRMNWTLRFPRLVKIRWDKDWTAALTTDDFWRLKGDIDGKLAEKQEEKKLQLDASRHRRTQREIKKIKVAGGTIDDVTTPYAGPETKIFQGLTFYIMGESSPPFKMKKPEIEQLVKANGGAIVQTYDAVANTICVAERRTIKVAALEKRGDHNIIRPKWLFHCISQCQIDIGKPAFLLPLEPDHMHYTTESDSKCLGENVDEYGDSYTRDVTARELKLLFDRMEAPAAGTGSDQEAFRKQLEDHGHDLGHVQGWLLERCTLLFDGARPGGLAADAGGATASTNEVQLELARMTARFAAATIAEDISDPRITHVVSINNGQKLKALRNRLMEKSKLQPRIVSPEWILDSWHEKTQLAEERYPVQ